MKQQFSKQQLHFIQLGKSQRESLKSAVIAAIVGVKRKRKHTLVYSPTGLGKTYVFKEELDKHGIDYAVISGKQSLFQIALNLLVYYHLKPKGEPMVILFDDCDVFFTKADLMNVLKNMTEGENSLVYNVNIIESQLTPVQLEAYKKYKSKIGKGFVVPCDEFVFFFTTNFMLPFDQQVDKLRKREGNSSKVEKLESLAAFRSRFRTKDYPMDKDTKWGYLTYVLMECDLIPELDEESKMIMADWILYNWDKLKETNLRTLEKMGEDMLDYPDTYKDVWEADYLMFDDFAL
jgi:hypothetical protein